MVAVRQHLGRKALHPDVRETHRGHRAAQLHAPARPHRQRRKPPRRLEQRQIIPRIHLHGRVVMESRARDEKAGAAGGPFISRVRTPYGSTYGSITAR